MKSFIILICLCVGCVSCSSASSALDTPEDVGNTFQQWFRIEKHKVVGTWSDVENKVMGACSCIKFDCGCCAHLEEKTIELNSTICVNVTYLVHDYGMSFTVTVDKYTIFNETVSARNPPPVCLGVPYVQEFVDACIRLYNIDATIYHLHACVRLEARMKTVLIAKYELGCFTIGPPGLSSRTEHPALTAVFVEEDRLMTLHRTSLESHAASGTSSATNVTVIALAITTGLILVAVVISTAIALASKRGLERKRGMKAFYTDLLLNSRQNYGRLISASDDGSVKC